MADYYDASMRIGGPMTAETLAGLLEAIDNDAPQEGPEDPDAYIGTGAIEIGCESRAWGDYRETREFCNTHGICYDLDSSNGTEMFRFSFRPGVHLEDEWPENPVGLLNDEPAVSVATVRAELDRLAQAIPHANDLHSPLAIIRCIRALCDRNTPPALEPISLVGSPLCKCDNCGHLAPRSELKDIQDYEQRVDEDGTEPDGECPECGCLAYELAKEANAS